LCFDDLDRSKPSSELLNPQKIFSLFEVSKAVKEKLHALKEGKAAGIARRQKMTDKCN
jgi:hypothetical protein